MAGRFAIGSGAGVAREARKSAVLSTGVEGCAPGAAIAGDVIKPRAARANTNLRTVLFIVFSFLERLSTYERGRPLLNISTPLPEISGDARPASPAAGRGGFPHPWLDYWQVLRMQWQKLVQPTGAQSKLYSQPQHREPQLACFGAQKLTGAGQSLGHTVVTPSQVTDPRWATEQSWSTAEQLVVLLLPSQLMVPPGPQFAEAVHRAFPVRAGRFAMGTGAGVAREARKVLSDGAPCGTPAAVAGGTRKTKAVRITEIPQAIFFIAVSFLEQRKATIRDPFSS